MAETKDPMAHIASLNVLPNSITMLNGQRYHQRYRFEANQYFKIPTAVWNVLKDDPSSTQHTFSDGHTYTMVQIVKWYLKQHFYHQLHRILDLERYYQGDNDIHYWKSNKIKRADNRIADNYPRYITNFDAGFLTGKPLKYSYSDKDNANDDGSDLLNEIKSFNNFSDTRSHDEQMNKDLLNTGRAYELEYVAPNTTKPKITRIDPNQCFVIWSTDVDSKELCGVRYTFNRIENNYDYTVEVYTDDKIFTFDAGSDVLGGNWTLINTEDSAFGDVPITEFILNKERMGIWEPELDDIDALDKALSEMANSQEDFSNATLVISGAVKRPSQLVPIKDARGHQCYYDYGHYQDITHLTLDKTDKKTGKPNRLAFRLRTTDTNANVMWLMPSTDTNGDIKSQPQIKYLTKQLDVNEWTAYVNKLESRIEKFTGVPDMNADQSSSNQTDYETAMKFIHAIENSSNIESNFRHGIIRRLHLLVNYLNKLPDHFTSNDTLNNPDDVTVHFDFNVPLDIQSTIQEIQSLVQTGDFSKQTIQELGAKFTGVSPDEEQKRLQSEDDEQQQSNSAELQSNFQNELNAVGMGKSNASNNASSNPLMDNHSSVADNHALNSSEMAKLSNSSSASKPQSETSLNSSQLKQSSANSTGNSLVNSYLAENASDPQMADNDLKYMTEYVDSNGSTVSFDNPRADNMIPGMFLIDSLYGSQMGFPSGWDSVMSSAMSVAFTSSMASAFAQSATDPGSGDVSDDDSDDYSDGSASSTTSSSGD